MIKLLFHLVAIILLAILASSQVFPQDINKKNTIVELSDRYSTSCDYILVEILSTGECTKCESYFNKISSKMKLVMDSLKKKIHFIAIAQVRREIELKLFTPFYKRGYNDILPSYNFDMKTFVVRENKIRYILLDVVKKQTVSYILATESDLVIDQLLIKRFEYSLKNNQTIN